MAYFPIIRFNTAAGKLRYQAELDCTVNQMNFLNKEHDNIEEETKKMIALAKEDLINKYSIEEV